MYPYRPAMLASQEVLGVAGACVRLYSSFGVVLSDLERFVGHEDWKLLGGWFKGLDDVRVERFLALALESFEQSFMWSRLVGFRMFAGSGYTLL